jgi:Condensation domain
MSDAPPRIADLSASEKRVLLAQLLRKQAGGATEHPLSYNQQGIWFLYQLAPESAVYNVNFAARIVSALNVAALRRAMQSLLDRHPSLRTTFPARAGKPVQQVHRNMKVSFAEVDGAAWSEDGLKTWMLAEAYRSFDLERGPLLRVSLIMRSAHEHVLLMVVHHIVVDFWSLAVLLDELGVLYPAECAGAKASLPPLEISYTDYVRWQAEMLSSPAGERLWAYWQKQLAGQLPVLDLPTDRPRPPVQTHRGASNEFTLDEALSSRLRALAREQGATLYTVLLAVFQVVLSYHTGQEDLQVGSPMVGRSRAEFEGIVGLFTNPVVLRADLSGNPAFADFLAQVRQTVLAALEHQDFPTVLLVERLHPFRDPSRPPLCQVMFVLDKPHRFAEPGAATFVTGDSGFSMNPGGLAMESIALERRAATLDLVLLIIETSGGLSASMRYNTDLFDQSSISRLSAHFETILRHVVVEPNARLSVLKDLLAVTDREEQARVRTEHRELNLQNLRQAKRKAQSVLQPAPNGVAEAPKYTNANGS